MELATLLKPFKEATKLMSGQKYTTIKSKRPYMQFTTVEKVGFLGPKKWKKLVFWVPKLKKLGFWVLQILCQPSCKIRKSREIPG